jgi:hypothetical protein
MATFGLSHCYYLYSNNFDCLIGSFGDANMAGVEVDEGRNICDFETCDVSDFYISDMIITSLPFYEVPWMMLVKPTTYLHVDPLSHLCFVLLSST